MHIVFVMDPVSTVLRDEDTSFAIMHEAHLRGHRVDHCLHADVNLEGGRVMANIHRAYTSRDSGTPILREAPARICLEDVDVVMVRKDPPFNHDYLWLTLILDELGDKTLVVNRPSGLRNANEKLYACHFPEVMPKTLIASDKDLIKGFIEEIGGKGVIKPLDGHGGEGVFALTLGDPNINGLIEAVTKRGARLAMVQSFIPEVVEGDKRILLLDGEVIGAILRVPQGGDVRSNIHVGGQVVATEVTYADRRVIDAVVPRLRRDGLHFVGLDVIGGYLTEVNVTSPTGIQQMSRLSGENCEAKVLDWLEKETA